MNGNHGIILLSFGTTYAETREKNIHALTKRVKEEYPSVPVLEAFSSARVRKVLRERDGIRIASIEEAMEEMREFGVRHLIVCPTHILDGYEYDKCKKLVEERTEEFETVSFGGPLLGQEEDYPKVAKAFWEGFSSYLEGQKGKLIEKLTDKSTGNNCQNLSSTPAGNEGEEIKYYVLMGHGTTHAADESYRKLEQELQHISDSAIYIATVEGETGIGDVIQKLQVDFRQECQSVLDKKPENPVVYVTPFMLVAGDHANHDMAGEEASFASALKEAGFCPVCILKGIGEYPEIQGIYLEKIKRLYEN